MKNSWIWMPHPAHFICSFDCRFHLATVVEGLDGKRYIVSTVGEHFPDAPVREILAKQRGVVLEGKGDARKYDYLEKCGYEDIGFQRKYETMVFAAVPSTEACCPWAIDVSEGELAINCYNEPGAATSGHMELCLEWSEK